MSLSEINRALETSGAGDAYLLVILVLLLMWSIGVVFAIGLFFQKIRSWCDNFAIEEEEDLTLDFDAGPTPIGYTAPHTDEMGWTEYVDEPIEETPTT